MQSPASPAHPKDVIWIGKNRLAADCEAALGAGLWGRRFDDLPLACFLIHHHEFSFAVVEPFYGSVRLGQCFSGFAPDKAATRFSLEHVIR